MVLMVENAPSMPQQPKRRFSRKLGVLAAAIVAAVIILVAVLIPQGAAVIPLEVNYTVGEKMRYTAQHQITVLNCSPQTGSQPSDATFNQNATAEVVDFDGQYYTLNYTYIFDSDVYTGTQVSNNFSNIQKVSKQGYTIVSSFLTGSETPIEYPNPAISGLLNRTEVRVGDTWDVPISSDSSAATYSSNTTLTFQGFEDLTVPAGTFHVFRVNAVGNMTLEFKNSPVYMTANENVTMYLELNTLRQIKTSGERIQTQRTVIPGDASGTVRSITTLQTSNMELTELIPP